jgi:hypothetical protein
MVPLDAVAAQTAQVFQLCLGLDALGNDFE